MGLPDVGLAQRGWRWSPPRWALWALPPAAIALAAVVELLTVTLAVGSWWFDAPDGAQWVTFAVLICCALLHVEVNAQVERVRDRPKDAPSVDLFGVWSAAGAILLPAPFALPLVALICLLLRLRSRPAPLHRLVFVIATVALGVIAGRCAVLAILGPADLAEPASATAKAAAVLAAVGLAVVVNPVLVAAWYHLTSPDATWRRVLGVPMDHAIELAGVSLGAFVACAYRLAPVLIILALPTIAVLQRTLLVGTLRRAARLDPKTGLLHAAQWQDAATTHLARSRRRGGGCAVLLIDLDTFKQVNDRYGHLAGDDVLRAVATMLRLQMREEDLVGRFGGEEFAIVLPETEEAGAIAVADRLRIGVADLVVRTRDLDGQPMRVAGVTASIGVAAHNDGRDLNGLLLAADRALYAAKRAGRNRVILSTETPLPDGAECRQLAPQNGQNHDHLPALDERVNLR